MPVCLRGTLSLATGCNLRFKILPKDTLTHCLVDLTTNSLISRQTTLTPELQYLFKWKKSVVKKKNSPAMETGNTNRDISNMLKLHQTKNERCKCHHSTRFLIRGISSYYWQSSRKHEWKQGCFWKSTITNEKSFITFFNSDIIEIIFVTCLVCLFIFLYDSNTNQFSDGVCRSVPKS